MLLNESNPLGSALTSYGGGIFDGIQGVQWLHGAGHFGLPLGAFELQEFGHLYRIPNYKPCRYARG